MAATVASLLLLSGLAACAGDSGESPTPSPTPSAAADANAEPTTEDVAALAAVTVAGEPGAEPAVTFAQPFTVTAPVARVTDEGTGEALTDGQLLTMKYLALSGADGSTQESTYAAAPYSFVLGDASQPPVLNEILQGQKTGTRFLLAIPGQADAATTVLAAEITAARTIPTRAEGAAVAPADGLPTVTLADDGAPTITPVKTDPPTDLVVQPLITGAGAPITAGQTVTFQYTGVLWDGTPFDSSWENGKPFTAVIGSGQVIPGWDQGLVGQSVGSQVLLVVPPALGYGDQDRDPIPANSTLIFVVDILDAG